MGKKQQLDVSWEGALKIFLVGFVFYFVYLVRDSVIWFAFALIISVLLDPVIIFLKKLKIPRIIGAILVYLSIFGFLGFLIYLTAPIFVFEIKQLSLSLPQYFQEINPYLENIGVEFQTNLQGITQDLSYRLKEISAGVFGALSFVFGGVFSTLFIISLAFFLSIQEKGIERIIVLFTPKKYEQFAINLFKKSQRKVSRWFGSRVLACLFVGIASFLFFLIFDVKYAFMLALLAGILNFIPYIGVLVASILIFVFIAVSDLWVKAVFGVLGFAVIQQIENYVLTPILTSRIVGLPPAAVLLSLVIGGQLLGILGAIFAIPVAGILYEFLKEYLERRKLDQVETEF